MQQNHVMLRLCDSATLRLCDSATLQLYYAVLKNTQFTICIPQSARITRIRNTRFKFITF